MGWAYVGAIGALYAAAALGTAGSAAAKVTPPPAWPALTVRVAVKTTRDSFTSANFVPGMAIAVVSATPSGSLTTRVYLSGVADVASRREVTRTTQFEIGSETKLFTAALLARAVQRGTVQVTDPITTFVPGAQLASCGSAYTLGDLATHRSGLPRVAANYNPQTAASYTAKQLFSAVSAPSLAPACPGTGWVYSNFGYGLLGTVLAQKEGTTYGELVHRIVTKPLGMRHTRLEEPTPHLATGYRSDQSVATPWDNTGALAGGGGLISSITDMSKFIRAQLGSGQVAAVDTLLTTQELIPRAGDSQGPQMGMAWQIYQGRAGTWGNWLFKNGGTSGMHSATVIVPTAKLGVTVLSNGPVSPGPVPSGIVRTLLGLPPSAAQPPPDGDSD